MLMDGGDEGLALLSLKEILCCFFLQPGSFSVSYDKIFQTLT